jgi:murein DD-endopeptidase MepM/ murein hydrolase activator NlpD
MWVSAVGTIVSARNDVSDMLTREEYLKLKDPLSAIGGNLVIIDHENGEHSLLAHMKQGSVRVKVGDRVKQGQVIGLLGASGSPGYAHLHYQLQASPGLFNGDGLPSQFENLETIGWLHAGERAASPRRGLYYRALPLQ